MLESCCQVIVSLGPLGALRIACSSLRLLGQMLEVRWAQLQEVQELAGPDTCTPAAGVANCVNPIKDPAKIQTLTTAATEAKEPINALNDVVPPAHLGGPPCQRC